VEIYKWLDQCKRCGEVTDTTCGGREAALLYGQYTSLMYSIRSEKITRDKQRKIGQAALLLQAGIVDSVRISKMKSSI
jgi:hypothetical protein